MIIAVAIAIGFLAGWAISWAIEMASLGFVWALQRAVQWWRSRRKSESPVRTTDLSSWDRMLKDVYAPERIETVTGRHPLFAIGKAGAPQPFVAWMNPAAHDDLRRAFEPSGDHDPGDEDDRP